MPMSPYVRGLRALIGTTVLEVPSASVLAFDEQDRILLVRHVEGNDWTTPGGMIEPYELARRTPPSGRCGRRPGFRDVALTRIVGVFGGELCSTTYRNGDRVAWVSTVFAAEVVGRHAQAGWRGDPRGSPGHFARAEIDSIRCKPHLRLALDAAWSPQPQAHFQQSTWTPPLA